MTQEKVLALEYATATKAALDSVLLARQPFHRVVQTRTTDTFLTLEARANIARNHGADIFISIHFNSGASSARGTETLIQGSANVNIDEDGQFATLVQAEAATAVGFARVPGVKDFNTRIGPGVPSDWGVLRDPRLGNTGNFLFLRSCIQEVDFITNPAALAILTDPVAGSVQRSSYAAGVAAAIVTDLETQPLP